MCKKIKLIGAQYIFFCGGIIQKCYANVYGSILLFTYETSLASRAGPISDLVVKPVALKND